MAIDTWKIESDQRQKLILEWLDELNQAVLMITSEVLDDTTDVAFQTDAERRLVENLTKSHEKLKRFGAKGVPEHG